MRVVASLGLVLGIFAVTALDTHAQTSCQAFFSQCSQRCVSNTKGETKAKCTADHCSPKLAACRQSGCWTEGAAFGGGKSCDLKK